MNKQELIEKIKKAITDEFSSNYYRKVDNYGYTEYEHYTEDDAQSVANDIILDLEDDLKQLDEPQKRIMPKFFDDWAKQVIEQRDKFYAISLIARAGWGYGVDYELDENRSPSATRELLDWLAESSLYINKEKAVEALLYGYEVEKEPVYYVKRKDDDTYFVKFVGSRFKAWWDGSTNYRKMFTDKAKADAVALLVDGEVVEG